MNFAYWADVISWVNLTVCTFVVLLFMFLDSFSLDKEFADRINMNIFGPIFVIVLYGVIRNGTIFELLVNYLFYVANLSVLLIVFMYALNVFYIDRLRMFNKGEY